MKKEEKQKEVKQAEAQKQAREKKEVPKGNTTTYISAIRSPTKRYLHRPDGPGGNYPGF